MLYSKHEPTKPFRILSLDGGGAKGFYTLGVLREIEALTGSKLFEVFDLVFGTSTGSIIAALITLGFSVDDIHNLYKNHVPKIMKGKTPDSKSKALAELADEVFGDSLFDNVKTGIGIVSTKWSLETPMIFKGNVAQAHGQIPSFVPGFGVSISKAVQASCSAYPFFKTTTVNTIRGDNVELVDGGYCANNPTLYAIADGIKITNGVGANLRVLSIGVGTYPEPNYKFFSLMRWAKYIKSVQLLQKTLEINTQSMDQLRQILFKHVPTVRISDTFSTPEMATDLFEHDLNKLNILRQRGTESFAKREAELYNLLQN